MVGDAGRISRAVRPRRMGFGAMDLSEPPRDDRAATALLHRAVDLGIDVLDTADRYGSGHNEELIGRALADRRDDFYLSTKVGFVGRPNEPHPVDNSPEHILRACDDSLARLRTDHVDLFLLHRVDLSVPLEDSIGTLAELKAAGKTLRIGVSEVGPTTLRAAHAIHPLDAVQIEYSLASREPGDTLLAVCRELGIQLHASSPLGIGLLGKASTDLLGDEPTLHRRLRNTPRGEPEPRTANAARLQELGGLAQTLGCSPAQLALAWLAHRGSDVVPLPGTRRMEHLEANLAAREIVLDADTLGALERQFPSGAFAGARKAERQLSLTPP